MTDESKTPDRYGIIGYPVSHSRSPVIHQLFAEQTKQNMRYDLLPVAPDQLEASVRQFQREGVLGLNVTAPHKQRVSPLCDHLSERARTAGATNTLIFQRGEIVGDNTDGIGLLRDLAVNLELNLEGMNILILGAGGAAHGVVGPLLEMQPRAIVVANRTIEKAEVIAQHLGASGPVSATRFDAVPTSDPFDLIINATSAGLHGETPPYPEAAVGDETVCYDLSYALKPTPFCLWAQKHGAARSVMGWGMLVEQAAESFNLWRGLRPDTAPVLEKLNVSA